MSSIVCITNDREHVLHRPDTFVGGTTSQVSDEFVMVGEKIVSRSVTYSPALINTFMEIVNNATDNAWRSSSTKTPTTRIVFRYARSSGQLSLTNNGLCLGIDKSVVVSKDPEVVVHVPTAVFGVLRTSSNYDDTETERLTSGRNGYGAKLTNIFSKEFDVQVHTGTHVFLQSWEDNMSVVGDVHIEPSDKPSSVTVQWTPDYARLDSADGLTDDILGIMLRNLAACAVTTGVPVRVVDVDAGAARVLPSSPEEYVALFTDAAAAVLKHGKTMVVVTADPAMGVQSFVNGIPTRDGGVHVRDWTKHITTAIAEHVRAVAKSTNITDRDVRPRVGMAIFAGVNKPSFSSQEKTKLTGPGKVVSPSEALTAATKKFVKDIKGWPLIADLVALAANKIAPVAVSPVHRGYDPASLAGGPRASECVLMYCEGDTAKSYIVGGIDVGVAEYRGRSHIGVLPCGGKILNVRNKTPEVALKNAEISTLISVLGLKLGRDYSTPEAMATLRYGALMIVSDADDDGTHIRGLVLNLFDTLFPSLLKNGFVKSMLTPVIRAKNRATGKTDAFFTLSSFTEVAEQYVDAQYYKGLGSISARLTEATFGKKVVEFEYTDECREAMTMAFSDGKTNERKRWIQNAPSGTEYSTDLVDTVTLHDFVHKDLVQYSIADCARSLPSMIDGLKESQRKIVYGTMDAERNGVMKAGTKQNRMIKVAQLAGHVASVTAYLHGEQCLSGAITKMAQTYVGSNNVALLWPDGQFGTRAKLGADCGSPRYIHTRLQNIVHAIFRKEDLPILEYRVDDGVRIEPVTFAPIIPMILVNGASGIGTGWSTSIPSYNPADVVAAVRWWIEKTCRGSAARRPKLVPWFRGFTGTITVEDGSFTTNGVVERAGKKSVVTELPIGVAIEAYVAQWREKILDKTSGVMSVMNESTTDAVRVVITSKTPVPVPSSTHSTKNMVGFDETNTITKYDSVYDILGAFCKTRLAAYDKRRAWTVRSLSEKVASLEAREKFIRGVLSGEFDLSSETVEDDLAAVFGEEAAAAMINTPIRSLTKKRVEDLRKSIVDTHAAIDAATKTPAWETWLAELAELDAKLEKLVQC